MDLTKNREKLYELYKPSTKEFVFVDVPRLPFAIIEGKGNPEDEETSLAIHYMLKLIAPIKKRAKTIMGSSFIQAPIEMLYWADDMNDIIRGNKDNWKWKVMITLPVWIDDELFKKSVDEANKTHVDISFKPTLEWFKEGLCVQIMHKGDIKEIPNLLDTLYTDFLPSNDLTPYGPYHEIYLDSKRSFDPLNCKMILRQSVHSISL